MQEAIAIDFHVQPVYSASMHQRPMAYFGTCGARRSSKKSSRAFPPALFALLSFVVVVLGGRSLGAAGAEPPRLAVLLVFDQLRGDYLSRWQQLFGERGF